MRLSVNRQAIDIDADPEMPLLWALRDLAVITGPTLGCGIAARPSDTPHWRVLAGARSTSRPQ
jgi:isoquinoline 1-oxidoreductase alpha subunit